MFVLTFLAKSFGTIDLGIYFKYVYEMKFISCWCVLNITDRDNKARMNTNTFTHAQWRGHCDRFFCSIPSPCHLASTRYIIFLCQILVEDGELVAFESRSTLRVQQATINMA